jgi:plasmid stabilization system protein ParE
MVAPAEPYRIDYKPKALADIEEIRAYIAQDSPERADQYARFLLESVASLSRLPTSLRVYERRSNPAMSVRTKNVDSYIIYFRVDESERVVTILAIRHGTRRQPRRFR